MAATALHDNMTLQLAGAVEVDSLQTTCWQQQQLSQSTSYLAPILILQFEVEVT